VQAACVLAQSARALVTDALRALIDRADCGPYDAENSFCHRSELLHRIGEPHKALAVVSAVPNWHTDHGLNDLHWRTAALAQHHRPCFEVWQQPLGIELNKDELQQRNCALAVGVQEAKVSRAAKTFWQYVHLSNRRDDSERSTSDCDA